jgi:branched-chain amino acid aminotransferase
MPPYAYFQKKYVPLPEAKVNILTHALHYGTGVFEGIRGNWDKEKGVIYLFRVREHYQRLLDSAKLLKIKLPYTVDELCDITATLLQKSGSKEDVYIRPIAYKSAEQIGVRLHNVEDDYAVIVATLSNYLDLDKGIRCCTSSWRRPDDVSIPSRGKICGAYITGALAKSEAMERGFDEAIVMTTDGHVSEGSGENIFMVFKGQLVTPPASDACLLGITRDSVIQLARNELGIETIERHIDRSDLYIADEVFLTGTAAEVIPVTKVDDRMIGNGLPGPITKSLIKEFRQLTTQEGTPV